MPSSFVELLIHTCRVEIELQLSSTNLKGTSLDTIVACFNIVDNILLLLAEEEEGSILNLTYDILQRFRNAILTIGNAIFTFFEENGSNFSEISNSIAIATFPLINTLVLQDPGAFEKQFVATLPKILKVKLESNISEPQHDNQINKNVDNDTNIYQPITLLLPAISYVVDSNKKQPEKLELIWTEIVNVLRQKKSAIFNDPTNLQTATKLLLEYCRTHKVEFEYIDLQTNLLEAMQRFDDFELKLTLLNLLLVFFAKSNSNQTLDWKSVENAAICVLDAKFELNVIKLEDSSPYDTFVDLLCGILDFLKKNASLPFISKLKDHFQKRKQMEKTRANIENIRKIVETLQS